MTRDGFDDSRTGDELLTRLAAWAYDIIVETAVEAQKIVI